MFWIILFFLVIPCVVFIVLGVIAETGGPRPNLPKKVPLGAVDKLVELPGRTPFRTMAA